MHKTIRVVALVLLWAALPTPAGALPPPVEQEFTCPVNGRRFKSFVGQGGRTHLAPGALDFEPMVMGTLRLSVIDAAECPGSGLPLFRRFQPDEVAVLQALVATPGWAERRRAGNQYYLTAYARAALGEDSRSIATALLAAVWTSREANNAFLLEQALTAWTRIADAVPPAHGDWAVANWLRIDLNRQAGTFEQADYWLRRFVQHAPAQQAPVDGGMIGLERQLINARDPRPAAFVDGEARFK